MTNKYSETACHISSDLDHAELQCQTSGKRLTQKRKQILAILLRQEKAVSAYDVIEYFYREQGERLAPTSMYRILEFLEREHLVHRLKMANKFVACSHILCSEHHEATQFLICSHCHKVKEVILSPQAFEELKRNSSAAGFEIEQPQLEINCICSECR